MSRHGLITEEAILAALASGPLTASELAYRIEPGRFAGAGWARHILEVLSRDGKVVKATERRRSERIWALAGAEVASPQQGTLL